MFVYKSFCALCCTWISLSTRACAALILGTVPNCLQELLCCTDPIEYGSNTDPDPVPDPDPQPCFQLSTTTLWCTASGRDCLREPVLHLYLSLCLREPLSCNFTCLSIRACASPGDVLSTKDGRLLLKQFHLLRLFLFETTENYYFLVSSWNKANNNRDIWFKDPVACGILTWEPSGALSWRGSRWWCGSPCPDPGASAAPPSPWLRPPTSNQLINRRLPLVTPSYKQSINQPQLRPPTSNQLINRLTGYTLLQAIN